MYSGEVELLLFALMPNHSHVAQIIDPRVMMQIFQGRCVPDLYDLYDLYDPAHVAGCKPYHLHDPAQVSWVGSAFIQILHNVSQRQGGIQMM